MDRLSQSLPILLAGILAACSERTTTAPAPTLENDKVETAETEPAATVRDACGLLTKEEIASVLGEELKETKKVDESERGFHVSVCLFVMPTMVNSVTLRLVERAGGTDARDPREAWNDSFAPEKLQAIQSTGGEKVDLPEKVADVGDEAFWRPSKKGGALYALKGNTYIRVGLQESRNPEDALSKCSALAAAALKNL